MRRGVRVRGWFLLAVGMVACVKVTDPTDDTDLDTDTDALPGDTDDTDVVVEDTDTGVLDTDGVTPGCVLGTGELALTPLVSGGDAVVTKGSQGRWHVFGAVTCTGIVGGGVSGSNDFADLSNPDNPTVDWKITDLMGNKLAGYEGLHRPMTTPTGTGMVGEYLVFWSGCYDTTVDTDAVMTFHLVDKNAVTVDLSVPVRLVAEPGYVTDTDACP